MRRRSILLLSALTAVAVLGCQGEKGVKFGAVLPLSGSAQVYGESVRYGMEVALDEIRAREDRGYAIELVIQDSESSPDKAAELAQQLYADGAWAVIGGVTTAEALEMVPVADRADRVLVSPTASSPELTGISKNFYRVFPSDFHEGTKMGNFAAQTLQLETAVILAATTTYAIGVQQVFQAEFERNGGEVLDIVEFPENISDFSGLLDRVMTLKPDCVYLAAFATDIAAMIEGLREREYGGTILTTHAFATGRAIQEAGEGATGVFLTQTAFELESEDPRIREFVAAYEEKHGMPPDIYAAHGYDAFWILTQALGENVVTASDLWKGMRSLRNAIGITGSLQFDERGDVQKFPRVYVIDSEGKLLNYENEVERRRRELLERLRDLQREAVQGGN